MATIKEMAQKAGENYLGEAFEQDIFADGYAAGANAILKEIEKALVYPKNDGQRIMIEKKIKELKGE